MIKRETIDNREATVCYLTADFAPADADEAELIKIIFDDGEVMFGVPAPQNIEVRKVGAEE